MRELFEINSMHELFEINLMRELIDHRCVNYLNYSAKNMNNVYSNDSNNLCNGFKQFAHPMASNSLSAKLFEGANYQTISQADARIIRISGMREIICGCTVFKSFNGVCTHQLRKIAPL